MNLSYGVNLSYLKCFMLSFFFFGKILCCLFWYSDHVCPFVTASTSQCSNECYLALQICMKFYLFV